jgi:hypothetical protein
VCPNPVHGSPSVYAVAVVAFNPPSPSRLSPNLFYKKQELFTLREKVGSASICLSKIIVCLQALEKPEGAIKNEQSRNTGNIEQKTQQ